MKKIMQGPLSVAGQIEFWFLTIQKWFLRVKIDLKPLNGAKFYEFKPIAAHLNFCRLKKHVAFIYWQRPLYTLEHCLSNTQHFAFYVNKKLS